MKRELCGACAALIKQSYTLKTISGEVNNKVTCENCGRRRYGATYELMKKEKPKK